MKPVLRIRIQKKRVVRLWYDRYEVLPLDPRDPDIVRAKAAASGYGPFGPGARLSR